ncbi:hypothetical protein FFM54_36010 [Burkholderia pseudomallei]|nr:hypothetical protein FFM54_36010 [Burkholderia pseudomallei]
MSVASNAETVQGQVLALLAAVHAITLSLDPDTQAKYSSNLAHVAEAARSIQVAPNCTPEELAAFDHAISVLRDGAPTGR